MAASAVPEPAIGPMLAGGRRAAMKARGNRKAMGTRGRRMWPWLIGVLLLSWMAMGAWQRVKPLPETVGSAWSVRAVDEVRFLSDESWFEAGGERHLDQAIFDEALAMSGQARRGGVLDRCFFNDCYGRRAGGGSTRPASE